MNDKDLLQQAIDCPTMYFDGIGAYRNINGVLRCVGFVIESGAQLNLVISLTGAEAANVAARRLLDEGPSNQETPWSKAARTH